MPRKRHHDSDGVLCRRDGVSCWRVDHGDTLSSGSVQIDVVYAHASPADDSQIHASVDDGCSDLALTPNDERIIVRNGCNKLFRLHLQPYLYGYIGFCFKQVQSFLMEGVCN